MIIKDYVGTIVVRRIKDYEVLQFRCISGNYEGAKAKILAMAGNAPVLTVEVLEVGQHVFDEYVG